MSNIAPNGGYQNRIAQTEFFSDASGMTLKLKKLLGVDSGGALSSVVEHFLHTEGVAGSNPAARTIFPGENGENGNPDTVSTQQLHEICGEDMSKWPRKVKHRNKVLAKKVSKFTKCRWAHPRC